MDKPAARRFVILGNDRGFQVTLSLGPFRLQARSLLCVAATTPVLFAIFALPLPPFLKFVSALMVAFLAYALSVPEREGIWIGTYLAYDLMSPLFPHAVLNGAVRRANVRVIGEAVLVEETGGPFALSFLPQTASLFSVPRLATSSIRNSLFEMAPGGWAIIFGITGPNCAIGTEEYARWQDQLAHWVSESKVAAQVHAKVTHYDRFEAEKLFEQGVERGLQIGLQDQERQVYGEVAEASVLVQHYVIFRPTMASADGRPTMHSLTSPGTVVYSKYEDAERLAKRLLEIAPPELGLAILPKDTIVDLLSDTVIGARNGKIVDGMGYFNGRYAAYGAITALPEMLKPGSLVEEFLGTLVRGSISTYVIPMDKRVAANVLQSKKDVYQYAAERGDDDAREKQAQVEAARDTLRAGQALIERYQVIVSVEGATPQRCLDAYERLSSNLRGAGFDVVRVTKPAFMAAAAAAPGGIPLGRNLMLGTDSIGAALMPGLGTPFADQSDALVGVNHNNGAPAYIDVFKQANFNFLIVGTTGAGKSVSAKTMLMRQVLRGSRAIVIDPDSEYQGLVALLGGSYFELGDACLNPLSRPVGADGEDRTAWMASVISLLSVMGGEEVGYSRDSNMPIKALGTADKAWLQTQLMNFYNAWDTRHPGSEPILSDLLSYLEEVSLPEAKNFGRDKQAYELILRLRSYTQPGKGEIFDRPTTITWNDRITAVGLKALSNKFDADMTAALAFILSGIMTQLGDAERKARRQNLIVMVDEAHRIVGDPDAAIVLNRLIRQARKHGAGVWMASQSINDFMAGASDTLAGLIGTKLVLGVDEAVVNDVRDFFKLSDREVHFLSPFERGRGVLITNGPPQQRAIVTVTPPAPDVFSYLTTNFLDEQQNVA